MIGICQGGHKERSAGGGTPFQEKASRGHEGKPILGGWSRGSPKFCQTAGSQREPEWLVGYELKGEMPGFAEMESKLQLRNRVNLG